MRKRRPIGQHKLTCSNCDQPKEPSRINQGYCNGCHAAYMKHNRPSYAQLSDTAKLKSKVRAYANSYLNRGKIQRQGCEICGAHAFMHHDDYTKPLEIKWICITHRKLRYSDDIIKPSTMYGTPQKNVSVAIFQTL